MSLYSDLRAYVYWVFAMMDPVKIEQYGIETLNKRRSDAHYYLCRRYALDRETTKKYTDNLPTDLGFEKCCEWLHNALTTGHETDAVSNNPDDSMFCGNLLHSLFYLQGKDITDLKTRLCCSHLESKLRLFIKYSQDPNHIPIDRDSFTKAYRCCVYLTGLPQDPEKLQPSEVIMKDVARKTHKEACDKLLQFEIDQDFPLDWYDD